MGLLPVTVADPFVILGTSLGIALIDAFYTEALASEALAIDALCIEACCVCCDGPCDIFAVASLGSCVLSYIFIVSRP